MTDKQKLVEAVARILFPASFNMDLDSFTEQFYDELQDHARNKSQAAIQAISEAGYAIVPVEASEGMMTKMIRSVDRSSMSGGIREDCETCYTAAIQAGKIT